MSNDLSSDIQGVDQQPHPLSSLETTGFMLNNVQGVNTGVINVCQTPGRQYLLEILFHNVTNGLMVVEIAGHITSS